MMEHENAVTAIDLKSDNDFVKAQWFDTHAEVFNQLSQMIQSGWRVTSMGLVSDGENGPVVARPIKIKGQKRFTGIGIWNFSNHDADNY